MKNSGKRPFWTKIVSVRRDLCVKYSFSGVIAYTTTADNLIITSEHVPVFITPSSGREGSKTVQISENAHLESKIVLKRRDITVILSFSSATEQTNTVNN